MRRSGAVNLAAKSELRQHAHTSAMVDVRVGDYHRVERSEVNLGCDGVARFICGSALKHAEIDENVGFRGANERATSGDFARRAVDLQSGADVLRAIIRHVRSCSAHRVALSCVAGNDARSKISSIELHHSPGFALGAGC